MSVALDDRGPAETDAPENRMRIANTLKRLAARPRSPWPVLSVYVNTRPVGPQMTTYRTGLKKRMAEELAAFPVRSPERESLAVDFARVQHYLDYDLRPEARAAAVFSSYAGDDMFDAVQLPVELAESMIVVGPVPVLGPLLVVADRALPAIVLVADERAARLFVILLGAVLSRREVRAPASAEGDEKTRSARFATTITQALADLAAGSDATLAFLGGDAGIAATVRKNLPAYWRGTVLEPGAWDLRVTEDALAADVDARLQSHRAAERIEVARALVATVASGRAVQGVEATREALRQGGVTRLLFACGFGDRNAREELAALALAQGAAVQFVPAGAVPAFDAAGVGAVRD
jgi:hypothetical protein